MNKLKNKSRFRIENILSVSENLVIATNKIGKNFVSEKFSLEILQSIEESCPREIAVCAYENGYFGPCESVALRKKFWIDNMRLADDIAGANVFLSLEKNSLQLSTSREINANEELLLWFSENILSLMDIPFLTPANIQGKNSYVCHKCYKTFEVPNKLKIHLALSCNTFKKIELWRKLFHKAVEIEKPQIHPIMKKSMIYPMHSLENSTVTDPFFHLSNLSPPRMDESSYAAAAHFETIVSNMGSKNLQGHLCLYCGKLYSRKYGLKIHIRTHTGFKPLKCRHCFRAFGDPSNLNKHVKLHTNQKSSATSFAPSKSPHEENFVNDHQNTKNKLHFNKEDNHHCYPQSSTSTLNGTE